MAVTGRQPTSIRSGLSDRLAGQPAPRQALADGAGQVAAWRGRDDVRRLHALLSATDAASPGDAADFAVAVSPWFDDVGLIDDFLTRNCDALRADPLAALPWRMQPGQMVQGIVLAEAARGHAMLAVIDALMIASEGDGTTARLVFDGGLSLVGVLAGAMLIERWRLDETAGVIRHAESRWIGPGDRLALDNAQEQLLIRAAVGDVVVLTMGVAGRERRGLAREFDVASGALVRTGCGDPVVSRMLALLALVPQAAADERTVLFAALSGDADPALRWQAMRHWLACDAAAALDRLRDMAAGDADAAVRRAAGAALTLVAKLREAGDAA